MNADLYAKFPDYPTWLVDFVADYTQSHGCGKLLPHFLKFGVWLIRANAEYEKGIRAQPKVRYELTVSDTKLLKSLKISTDLPNEDQG